MIIVEWMELCFGKNREGNIVRIISVVVNIIFVIGIMSYFVVGGGKFLGEFLGIDDRVVGILLILLVFIYIVVSGFYGVVLIDVF